MMYYKNILAPMIMFYQVLVVFKHVYVRNNFYAYAVVLIVFIKHFLYSKHFLLMLFKLLDHLPHSIGFVAVGAISRIILVNVIRPLDEDEKIKGQSNSIKDDSSNTESSCKSVDACPSNPCCSSTGSSKTTNFKDTPDYVKTSIN